MARPNTIYESAHKGDFDLIKSRLDEDPSLLTKEDEVSKQLSYVILRNKCIIDQTNFTALVLSWW